MAEAGKLFATTPSQTVGPYFPIGLPFPGGADVVPAGTPGLIRITGTVYDGDGVAIPDHLIETWQADPEGRFADLHGYGGRSELVEAARSLVDLEPRPAGRAAGVVVPEWSGSAGRARSGAVAAVRKIGLPPIITERSGCWHVGHVECGSFPHRSHAGPSADLVRR